MTQINEMKVITRKVSIENEEYILVKLNTNTEYKYGTINYKDIYYDDSTIKLAKGYNGFDLALAPSIEGAINERIRKNKIDKFLIENNIDMFNQDDVVKYIEFIKSL